LKIFFCKIREIIISFTDENRQVPEPAPTLAPTQAEPGNLNNAGSTMSSLPSDPSPIVTAPPSKVTKGRKAILMQQMLFLVQAKKSTSQWQNYQ
jgi:hypothetical protein